MGAMASRGRQAVVSCRMHHVVGQLLLTTASDATAPRSLSIVSGVAFGAFVLVLSTRLLYRLVATGIFLCIVVGNSLVALLWHCSRPADRSLQRVFVPCSTLTTLAVVALDRAVVRGKALDTAAVYHLLPTLLAICGITTTTSFLSSVVRAECRACAQSALGKLAPPGWGTRRQVLRCEGDLARTAPGKCAICLDDLASLPPAGADASAPAPASAADTGLLRLPCDHTFHRSCVDRWIASEMTCPICRQAVDDLEKCVCISLSRREEDEPLKAAVDISSEPAPPDAERCFYECL